MSERNSISRWLEVPVGLFLGLIALVCTIGSVVIVVTSPGKNPVLAIVIGLFMLVACFWMLEKCVRLVIGRPNKSGGLFSPGALQIIAWIFLVMALGGLFSGRGLIGVVQAIAYVLAFFGLRVLARSRSAGTSVDPNAPEAPIER
jgi:hypothetical protein